MNPAVIGTDVVERKVVDGVLITHRLVSSKWYFPRWAQAVSILRILLVIVIMKQFKTHQELICWGRMTLIFHISTFVSIHET